VTDLSRISGEGVDGEIRVERAVTCKPQLHTNTVCCYKVQYYTGLVDPFAILW